MRKGSKRKRKAVEAGRGGEKKREAENGRRDSKGSLGGDEGGAPNDVDVLGDSAMELDPEVEELLAGMSDEEEKEAVETDPRILIPWPLPPSAAVYSKGGHGKPGRSSDRRGADAESRKWEARTRPFRKGDVVWHLAIRKRDQGDGDEERPPTEADLTLANGDWDEAGEFVYARLCLVKMVQGADKQRGSNLFAMVIPLYDHLDESRVAKDVKAERIDKRFIFKYERIYAKNEKILSCFRASIKGKLGSTDFFQLSRSLPLQVEDVKDYFRRKAEANSLDPFSFLPVDRFERLRYLQKLGLEASGDVEMAEDDDLFEMPPADKSSSNSGDEVTVTAEFPGDGPASSDLDDEPPLQRGPPSDLNMRVREYFQKEEVHEYLAGVMRGTVKSTRHNLMTKARFDMSLGSDLLRLANSAYLDPDDSTASVLRDLIGEKVYRPNCHALEVRRKTGGRASSGRASGGRKRSAAANGGKSAAANGGRVAPELDPADNVHFERHYIFNVLVPEGIVHYLQEESGLSKIAAEKEFVETTDRCRRKEERRRQQAEAAAAEDADQEIAQEKKEEEVAVADQEAALKEELAVAATAVETGEGSHE